MQEAVISSPWMVPQNHLSFSKASISRLNPAAGTLPAFYLLPERASENTSKNQHELQTMVLITGWRWNSQPAGLTGSKATRWTEMYTKGQASSQRPRVRSQDCPLQQPWISCSSFLDLQREMIFTGTICRDPEREIKKKKKRKATLQHSNSQIIAFGLKCRLLE